MPVKSGRNTRNQILQLVKMKGRASIREASQFVGVTAMAVRRHVRQLQEAGLLRREKANQGRGRPAEYCILTEAGDALFPRTYDRFCTEILDILAGSHGEAKVNRLLETRKQRLAARYLHRLRGKTPEERLQEVVAILCEEGYMAEYAKISAERFVVTEHNCAIARIAQLYPQTCESELCLLAQLLQADVRRQDHVLKGDSACAYLVEFPAKTKAAPAQSR